MGVGLIVSETTLLNVQFSFNALLISKLASTSAKSGQRNANLRQNHNIDVPLKTPTSLYKWAGGFQSHLVVRFQDLCYLFWCFNIKKYHVANHVVYVQIAKNSGPPTARQWYAIKIIARWCMLSGLGSYGGFFFFIKIRCVAWQNRSQITQICRIYIPGVGLFKRNL